MPVHGRLRGLGGAATMPPRYPSMLHPITASLLVEEAAIHGKQFRSSFPHHHVGGVARRRRGRGRGRLSAAAGVVARGHPGGAGPAAAGAEPHHHAAPGRRRVRNPLRRFRGADARHLDPHPGAQHGRQAAALRAVPARLPALARRLRLRRQVRHPQLAGRRPGQRAGDHRAGGGRSHCQEIAARALRHRGDRLRQAGPEPAGGGGPRNGDAGTGGVEHRPLPRRRLRRGHDRAHRLGAPTGRFARRRGRSGGARRAGRLGHAGVRQAGGGPRQGADVAAGLQGV